MPCTFSKCLKQASTYFSPETILKAGANKELGDNTGWTALQWAERKGHAPIAELLQK